MEPIARRPAAPIPPVFDPNDLHPIRGWVDFFRSGANIIASWNDRQYVQPIFMIVAAGKRMFYVNDPDLISEVLKENTGRYKKSKIQEDTVNIVLGQGLLGTEGEVWRHDRKLMAPIFQPRNFAAFEQVMEREATLTATRLVTSCRDGKRAVNVMHETSQLALKVIADILFGGLEDKDLAQLSSATEAALGRTRYLAALMVLNPLPQINRPVSRLSSARLNRLVDRLAAQFIERYRADPAIYKDTLLGRLIQAADSDAQGFGATRTDEHSFVRDQIATMLLAGHETTAKTLAWMLYLLAFDVDRAQKLRKRLKEGDQTYLEAFIDEALRLYPAAFVMNRDVREKHQLGDRTLKVGDWVMISPWLVHRNSVHWTDAELFRPERWLGEEAATIPKTMYLPFGTGPRVCIGAALAKLELRKFISAFVLGTDIEILDMDRVMPQAAVTLSARPEIWGRFRAIT